MKYNRIYTLCIALMTPWAFYKFIQSPTELWVTVGLIVVVYFYTDILSGFLHIILDNERSLDVPVIDGLAQGFQNHHNDPRRIHEMTWYEHLYVMHLPLTIVFPIVVIVNQPAGYLIYILLVISLHLMQMSHRWAHTPKSDVPEVVKVLQNVGFFLSRKAHGQHHNNVYDQNFAIMNGWSNPILNRVVKIFGKSSHGWIAVFVIASLLILTCPAFIDFG